MSLRPKSRLTPEEYLAIERKAEYKSEYFDGEMFAMAGASEQHISIVANLMYLLVGQFKGRPCKAYSTDMKVKITKTGLYAYPDVVVVCGEVLFGDEHKDMLVNPTLIIEVLSDSTEAYDRGEKFDHYRSIESLSDYLLVAQDKPKLEHFTRQPDDRWLFSVCNDIRGIVKISSIKCELPLADVYDKVGISVE